MNEAVFLLRPSAETGEAGISHEVCCTDEQKWGDRISMCGQEIEDGPLEGGAPDCVVCNDLLGRWEFYLVKYGEDPQLPEDEPCRVCPRRNKK